MSGRATAGNSGSPESAVVVAAVVVAGAVLGVGLALTEGARYDGWVAVNPDEPLRLDLVDGGSVTVPLSGLTPELASQSTGATLFEGSTPRFERLGRAPLDRAGFTMTSALHGVGLPLRTGELGVGLGGYVHVGGNIADRVTLGAAATADGGVDTRPTLLATVGPEITVFPIKYAGVYLGAGWAFRNTTVNGLTHADSGWLMRGGVLGELPISTRLALQMRCGAARYDLGDGKTPIGWEGVLGLAVY